MGKALKTNLMQPSNNQSCVFGATKKGGKPKTKASFTVSVSEVFIIHSSEMSSHMAELY